MRHRRIRTSPAGWRGGVLVWLILSTAGMPFVAPDPAGAAPVTYFSDGFESGTFSAWSVVRTGGGGAATVQTSQVSTGTYAARLSAAGSGKSYAYARASLGGGRSDVVAAGDFYLESAGGSAGNVPLLRLFDPAGTRLVSLYRQNGTTNKLWVQHSGSYNTTTGLLTLGRWARVEVRTVTAGAGASTVEARLDGALIYQTTTASLGTTGTATVQIGNDTQNQVFALYADNVAVAQPGTTDTTAPETTITAGPSGTVTTTDATFAFSADEPGATFACRLDAGGWEACTSPKSYTGLASGGHTFEVRATDTAGNTDAAPGSRPWTIATGGGTANVLVGAGDIAQCNNPGDEATAGLLDGIAGTVFTAGDNVYPNGTAAEFTNCYAPSWGRHKARTRPATGNHDYDTAGATGYFGYFGVAAGDPAKGYYSYELGVWHIVVLNTNCTVVAGGCGAGSPQELWLRADLAAAAARCSVVYFHHPLFSSGEHGNNLVMRPLYQAMYDYGVDVILAGHDHHYERFARQDPWATATPNGFRQFIVGTGGARHTRILTQAPNHEAGDQQTFGVFKLTLRDGAYDWQFIPEPGKTYTDSGTDSCVDPGTAPPPTLEFSDGFETGSFSAWSLLRTGGGGTATVQTTRVRTGTYAARLSALASGGSYAYARGSLSGGRTEVVASGDFYLEGDGAAGANVPLLRLFDPAGTRLVSLYRQNGTTDKLWVQHSGTYNATSGLLSVGEWAHAEVRAVTAGAGASTVEVRLDGLLIYRTTTASLGTAGAVAVQIGNDTQNQAFALYADNVALNTP
jgi:hypothetical protein